MKQQNSKKVMFIFSLHIHILSDGVYVIVVKFIGGIIRCKIHGGEIMSTSQISRWDYVHLYKKRAGGGGGGSGGFVLHSVE